MRNQPFENNTDQQTRRQVLKDTYLSRAQADAEIESQGRFKKHNPTIVTGTPEYPRQPSSSPWSTPDPTGIEPSLGYEIDALPALGGESPAPTATVETATTDDGGAALPPKGRDSALPSVSARSSFRRRVW